MLSRITHSTRSRRRSVSSPPALRREMATLRRDMDVFERQFSTWTQSRVGPHRQAEVRFHVIEAQLVRLAGSDTMGTVGSRPVATAVDPQPVVFPIGAYRT